MTARKPNAKGTVLVEAALTLLTLFVCLFAIMEAGRFFQIQQTLTNAAREGARFAVTPLSQTSTLPTLGEVQARVQPFLNSANITGATVAVAPEACSPAPTQCTRVTVTAPYQLITLSMFSSLSMTLRGEALMRNETSP